MFQSSFLVILLISAATGREGFGPGDQEWGYYDVRPGAHMFYWLYHTTASTERPLVIWIQGGPGASGAGYGNFVEIGLLDEDLNERNSSWVHEVNVLYIDNPVGSGFSYVDDADLTCRDNDDITRDLVNFTRQFMKEYPKFTTLPLYIFSESYGGKVAAQYAYALQKDIDAGNVQASLKGVALGNGVISHICTQEHLASYLFNFGFIDYEGYEKIQEATKLVIEAIEKEQWIPAINLGSFVSSYVTSETLDVNLYNVLTKVAAPSQQTLADSSQSKKQERMDLSNLTKLMNGPVKETLGIPANVTWGGQSGLTYFSLLRDIFKPVNEYLERLLNETNVEVIVYNGQLDLSLHTPGQLSCVEKLKWPGAENWRSSARTALAVNGTLEGYVKKNDRLSFYWILRSGHMVPLDNPGAALELLRQVTKIE